jgi:hypothetical protein
MMAFLGVCSNQRLCRVVWWTWTYTPESGRRSFEENQEFSERAKDGEARLCAKLMEGSLRAFHHGRAMMGEAVNALLCWEEVARTLK